MATGFAKERSWSRNAGLLVVGLTIASSFALSNSRAFFSPQASIAAAVLPGAGPAAGGALAPGQLAAAAFAVPGQVGRTRDAGTRSGTAANAGPIALPAPITAAEGVEPAGTAAAQGPQFAAADAAPAAFGGLPAGTGTTSSASPDVTSISGLPSSQTPGAGIFQVATTPTTPLPEPETWAMMGLGLGVVSLLLYRQRRRVVIA